MPRIHISISEIFPSMDTCYVYLLSRQHLTCIFHDNWSNKEFSSIFFVKWQFTDRFIIMSLTGVQEGFSYSKLGNLGSIANFRQSLQLLFNYTSRQDQSDQASGARLPELSNCYIQTMWRSPWKKLSAPRCEAVLILIKKRIHTLTIAASRVILKCIWLSSGSQLRY